MSVIRLRDIKTDRLRVACTRCGRRGDYAVARLAEKWGDDMGLPDLAFQLSSDCSRRDGADIYNRCDIAFAIGADRINGA